MVLFLASPLACLISEAGTVRTEGLADFENGIRNSVVTGNGGLSLGLNGSLGGNWTPAVYGDISERHDYAMAYDSLRGEVLLFGGGESITNKRFDETWKFNLTTSIWSFIDTPRKPMARTGSAMVYDSGLDVFVLFGGYDGMNENDTWVFYPGNDTWAYKGPVSPPPPRSLHEMVFDNVSGMCVMFGGAPNSTFSYNDTWTYDLRTNGWTNRTQAIRPHGRTIFGMAYDDLRGVTVLTGGYYYAPVAPYYFATNDTWTFNSATGAWSPTNTPVNPPDRISCAMAFDHRAGVVVLSGSTGATDNQTWEYNTTTNVWVQASLAVSPAPRTSASMVYCDVTGEIVMFGGNGYNPAGSRRDTWGYRSSTHQWSAKYTTSGPLGLTGSCAAYDRTQDEVIVFGGSEYTGGFSNQLWMFNLTQKKWRNPLPANPPAARYYSGCAYDEAGARFVMYGGSSQSVSFNDTWVYDPQSNIWINRSPALCPRAFYQMGMAFERNLGETVLFGGSYPGDYSGETWTYNLSANTWTNRTGGSSPTSRTDVALAQDPVSGKLILHGGFAYGVLYLNDTWVYDGVNNTWSALTFAKSPPPFPVRNFSSGGPGGDLVLFGVNYLKQETWNFNATTRIWTNRTNSIYLPARSDFVMAPASRNGEVLLTGGTRDGVVWIFNLRQNATDGEYISAPVDTGSESYFGSLRYDAVLPSGTGVRLQLRSAPTAAELADKPFVGPKGATLEYYTASGAQIDGMHNGSRFMQYRARLISSAPGNTPLLKSVTIGYNRLHLLEFVSPAGAQTWMGMQSVVWNATDPDGDVLTFDLYLLKDSDSTLIASDLNGTSWDFDTALVAPGAYRLRLVASDNNLSIPLTAEVTSGEFTVDRNNVPRVMLQSPADGAVFDNTSVELKWSGQDEDEDALVYSVFLADRPLGQPDDPVIGRTCTTAYNVTGLSIGKTYYWNVMANDSLTNSTLPAPRKFAVNGPPSVELLAPANESVVNSSTVKLFWNRTDSENDALTSHLFFSNSSFDASTLMAPHVNLLSSKNYTVSGLADGATYYWAVLPGDGKLNGTLTRVWNFGVKVPVPNRNPVINSVPPKTAHMGIEYVYNINATDPDNDTLNYSFAGPVGVVVSFSGRLTWTPTANQRGNMSVTVRVSDGRGGNAEQTFVVNVDVYKPQCIIVSPSTQSKITGKLVVTGTAVRGRLDLVRVEVCLDGGQWMSAAGTANWSFSYSTARLKNGVHSVEARSYDGAEYSDTVSVSITVNVPPPAKADTPWTIVGAIVAVAAIGGIGVWMMQRSRKAGPPGEEKSP